MQSLQATVSATYIQDGANDATTTKPPYLDSDSLVPNPHSAAEGRELHWTKKNKVNEK
jgi:hypothetical protein